MKIGESQQHVVALLGSPRKKGNSTVWNEDPEINPLYQKRIAIAMSYGDSDPFNSGCVNALRSFQDAYRCAGAKIVGMVYGSADEPGEIASNAELMTQAKEIGKKLATY